MNLKANAFKLGRLCSLHIMLGFGSVLCPLQPTIDLLVPDEEVGGGPCPGAQQTLQ